MRLANGHRIRALPNRSGSGRDTNRIGDCVLIEIRPDEMEGWRHVRHR